MKKLFREFSTLLIRGLVGGVVGNLLLSNAIASVEAGNKIAIAKIVNAKQEIVGIATFLQTSEGVSVTVQVQGLAPGEHAIHIHEAGKCEPPSFMSAGDHFNPKLSGTPSVNPTHHHSDKHDNRGSSVAGDLPNIAVEEDGTGVLVATLPKINLSTGADSLLKQGGTAILIHAGANGKSTIPNVDAKARIACGAIAP